MENQVMDRVVNGKSGHRLALTGIATAEVTMQFIAFKKFNLLVIKLLIS